MMTSPTPTPARPATDLSDWIGRSYVIEDEITVPAIRRIAATFDLPTESLSRGAPLPANWYTLFFPEIAPQSALGPDGHPRKGEHLPPISLPRRLFAGRRVAFGEPLRVGDAGRKRIEITRIAEKDGRSGPMVLLTTRAVVETARGVVVEEENDFVYREAVAAGTKSVVGNAVPAPDGATWRASRPLDPVLLYRYAAITWNGHRIHYDADYARREEGYSDCVQPGGLTIQFLLDEAERQAGRSLRSFEIRMTRPLFMHQTLVVEGGPVRDDRMSAWAADEQGLLIARAEVKFAEREFTT